MWQDDKKRMKREEYMDESAEETDDNERMK